MSGIPFAGLLVDGPGSREVDFIAVHERLTPVLMTAFDLGEIPVLGSPAWVDLAPDDVRWRHAVVVAGYRWAQQRWLQQDAEIAVSKELSAQSDWPAVASRIRGRAEYFKANPWAKRVSA